MKSVTPRARHAFRRAGGTTAAVQQIYDTTVGAETTDGSVLFEVTEAWSPSGAVVEVVDRAVFTAAIDEPRAVAGWFAGGVLTWESGANTGRSLEVKASAQATGEIELFLPMAMPSRAVTCSASTPVATSASILASTASPTPSTSAASPTCPARAC